MEGVRRTEQPSGLGRRLLAGASLGVVGVAVALLVIRLPLPVAVAFGLAAIGLAAAAAWPFVGLLLFVGLLYARPEDTFPELVGLRLILIVGSTVFLVWALRSVSARRMPVWSPSLGWMLAFCAAALLSLLPLPAALLGEGVNELARLLIILVLVTQLVHGETRTRVLCAVLVLMSARLALGSILNYYGGEALRSEQGLRALGTGAFDDPNDVALTLVPAVPLALVGLSRRAWGRWCWLGRLGSAACLALMLWGIYLTNSRGGMIALAGAFFVLALLRFGWRGALLGALAGVAVVLLGPSRMAELSGGDESAAGRIGAWRVGLELLAARPLTGVGMGQFTQYNELTAHNSLLLALAELGLLGGLCWVGLFVSAIRRAVSGIRVFGCSGVQGGSPGSAGILPAWPDRNHAGRMPALPAPDPEHLNTRIPEYLLLPALHRAALAGLIGYLIAAMFLSKTYFEIPYIYLGLLVALDRERALASAEGLPSCSCSCSSSALVRKLPRTRTSTSTMGWTTDMLLTVGVTVLGIAAIAAAVARFG
jgi:O-antigen ligase